MANINKLTVYHDALELVRDVSRITIDRGFGDLLNQAQRAAISVASNIAEGTGLGSDAQLRKFLCIARGSANELKTQLQIMQALGTLATNHSIIDLTDKVGRKLTRFIKHIECGSG